MGHICLVVSLAALDLQVTSLRWCVRFSASQEIDFARISDFLAVLGLVVLAFGTRLAVLVFHTELAVLSCCTRLEVLAFRTRFDVLASLTRLAALAFRTTLTVPFAQDQHSPLNLL